MVGAGLGFGIVPAMAVAMLGGARIRHHPALPAPEPQRISSSIKRRAASLSPAANALLAHFVAESDT